MFSATDCVELRKMFLVKQAPDDYRETFAILGEANTSKLQGRGGIEDDNSRIIFLISR